MEYAIIAMNGIQKESRYPRITNARSSYSFFNARTELTPAITCLRKLYKYNFILPLIKSKNTYAPFQSTVHRKSEDSGTIVTK